MTPLTLSKKTSFLSISVAQIEMRSCFFRPIWSTKPRTVLGQSRTRHAPDLHDRLIGFKAEERGDGSGAEGGPFAFSRLSKENGVEWLRFHHTTTTALPFSRSATSVILWRRFRRFRRFRWFGWFPLPNLKLLEFFSFSPLFADYGGRRLRQTARRKRRKRFAASATIIDSLSLSLSLSPFFSSVYFCPFRNFEKGKTRRQFLLDFNYRLPRYGTAELLWESVQKKQPHDTPTVCRPILPGVPTPAKLPNPNPERNALANRD